MENLQKDGKMVSKPGQRRVHDREIETLQKLYELAWFIATDTFDADVDPVLELEIRDHEKKIINLREADTTEVTTA